MAVWQRRPALPGATRGPCVENAERGAEVWRGKGGVFIPWNVGPLQPKPPYRRNTTPRQPLPFQPAGHRCVGLAARRAWLRLPIQATGLGQSHVPGQRKPWQPLTLSLTRRILCQRGLPLRETQSPPDPHLPSSRRKIHEEEWVPRPRPGQQERAWLGVTSEPLGFHCFDCHTLLQTVWGWRDTR